MESKSFNCTNCGAPLDYDGSDVPTIRCPFCNTSVIVPKELRPTRSKPAQSDQGTNRAGRMIALLGVGFIVLILGVMWLYQSQPSNSDTPKPTQVGVRTAPTTIPLTPTPLPTPTPSLASKVLTFGSEGTAPGTFNRSTNMAGDGVGSVYVGDRQGGRVQVFDSSGKFVTQWFVGNSKSILYSLAADRKGVVYTTTDGSIERRDGATGKFLDTLQYSGGNLFESIAMMPDGGLAAMWYKEHPGVLDSREGVQGDLVQFDPLGKVTRVISSVVSDQTDGPERDVKWAVDGTGNMYALSSYSYAVFKFSREGKFINRFGSRGNSPKPEQFSIGVSAIAIDNQGRVFVADSDRVLVFSADGRYLATFAIDGSVFGMAFDNTNALWLTHGDKVSKYTLNLP